ncbi:MAG: hypothetical protein JOZ17_18325 [Acetobacteraceae bacterium]|nr:hypothetical protein [Acetobacteraceae bacterium]
MDRQALVLVENHCSPETRDRLSPSLLKPLKCSTCHEFGDLLNSDYDRLTSVQFAHPPHFNHLNSVHDAVDFSGSLDFARRPAGPPDRVASRSQPPVRVEALRSVQ